MIDYKYVVFDVDVKLPSNEFILYHKGIFYELSEVNAIFEGNDLSVSTKNTIWSIVGNHSKLFTLNDVRRMKLETIKQKI